MQKSKLWHTLGLHGQEIQEIVEGDVDILSR